MDTSSPIYNPANWLRIGSLGLCLFLSQPSSVWAGAWTVPRNHAYGEYFYRYFGSKKTFDSEGHSRRRPKVGRFSDIRNEWKLEYGVTDWFNFLASVPYQSSHYRDDNTDLLTTGVGDIYLRTKLRMFEQPFVGSVQTSWKIPGGYDRKESPALGDGQFDFETRLLLSRSWSFSPRRVSVRKTSAVTRTDPVRTVASSSSAREAAIREAILLAELQHKAQQFARQGRHAEAEKWFRATAQQELQLAAKPVSMMRSTHDEPVTVATTNLAAAGHLPNGSAEQLSLPADAIDTETVYDRVAFVNLEGGFTARHGDPANEFPLFFEAGFTPLKRLMLVGSLESTLSVKSTHEDTEDFAKWGLRAIINVWGDGFASIFKRVRQHQPSVNLEVGYNDIFAGRNTADAFEVFAKLGFFF